MFEYVQTNNYNYKKPSSFEVRTADKYVETLLLLSRVLYLARKFFNQFQFRHQALNTGR